MMPLFLLLELNLRYVIFKRILVIDGWGNTCEIALTHSGCPATSPYKIPWLFPDHLVFFPDHETKYWRFITALTLILHAIWQITHQN